MTSCPRLETRRRYRGCISASRGSRAPIVALRSKMTLRSTSTPGSNYQVPWNRSFACSKSLAPHWQASLHARFCAEAVRASIYAAAKSPNPQAGMWAGAFFDQELVCRVNGEATPEWFRALTVSERRSEGHHHLSRGLGSVYFTLSRAQSYLAPCTSRRRRESRSSPNPRRCRAFETSRQRRRSLC